MIKFRRRGIYLVFHRPSQRVLSLKQLFCFSRILYANICFTGLELGLSLKPFVAHSLEFFNVVKIQMEFLNSILVISSNDTTELCRNSWKKLLFRLNLFQFHMKSVLCLVFLKTQKVKVKVKVTRITILDYFPISKMVAKRMNCVYYLSYNFLHTPEGIRDRH
jgi:hypothetical protein